MTSRLLVDWVQIASHHTKKKKKKNSQKFSGFANFALDFMASFLACLSVC